MGDWKGVLGVWAHRLMNGTVGGSLDHLLSLGLHPSNTVVLSGFFRSGTTFLMETLAESFGYRTCFEPLSPAVDKSGRTRAGLGLQERLPILQPEGSPSSPLDKFFLHVLTGKVTSKWTRMGRRFRTWWQRPLLVKSVRMNGVLGHLKGSYGCPTILLLRHPYAVAYSLSRLQGMKRMLSEAEPKSFLQGFRDLDEVSRQVLKRFPNPGWERIAFYHALSSYLPMQAGRLYPESAPTAVVYYESLAMNPHLTINRLAGQLGHREPHSVLSESSWSDWNSQGASAFHRCYAWESELPQEVRQIFEAVYRSFPVLETTWETWESLRVAHKKQVSPAKTFQTPYPQARP